MARLILGEDTPSPEEGDRVRDGEGNLFTIDEVVSVKELANGYSVLAKLRPAGGLHIRGEWAGGSTARGTSRTIK